MNCLIIMKFYDKFFNKIQSVPLTFIYLFYECTPKLKRNTALIMLPTTSILILYIEFLAISPIQLALEFAGIDFCQICKNPRNLCQFLRTKGILNIYLFSPKYCTSFFRK